jgi:uncharacterized protein (TIGR02118 family)
MIKLSILIPRRPDLTLAEFSQHWKEIHGPLFKSQPEVQRYVRRYVQVHSMGLPPGQSAAVLYDGIAEFWFDNIEDVTAVFNSENYREHIAPDEATFMDRENILWIYATENIVIP